MQHFEYSGHRTLQPLSHYMIIAYRLANVDYTPCGRAGGAHFAPPLRPNARWLAIKITQPIICRAGAQAGHFSPRHCARMLVGLRTHAEPPEKAIIDVSYRLR